MKIRFLWLTAAAVLALFTLSACVPSVELNERAIVQAIGVDAIDGGYRVTLQIFFPEGGEKGVDASKQNAKLISADGATIADAVQLATLKQGKQIFYGHNRLLMIGEKAAKNGIRDILPFFNSGYESRPSINVIIAKSKAEDILSTNIQQGIVPAESLENMVDNYTKNGSVIKTRLLDVIQAVYNESQSVAMPKIEMTQAQSSQEKSQDGQMELMHSVMINGSAVLKAEKLVGYFNQEETRGQVWLTDRMKQTLLVFPYTDKENKEDNVSIEIYRSKTKNSVRLENGRPVFTAKIETEGRINEMNLSRQFSVSADMERLEQQTAYMIQQECEAAFAKSRQYQADVFGYANLCMRTIKQEWKHFAGQWPQIFADAELELAIQVKIERIGLQTNNREK